MGIFRDRAVNPLRRCRLFVVDRQGSDRHIRPDRAWRTIEDSVDDRAIFAYCDCETAPPYTEGWDGAGRVPRLARATLLPKGSSVEWTVQSESA